MNLSYLLPESTARCIRKRSSAESYVFSLAVLIHQSALVQTYPRMNRTRYQQACTFSHSLPVPYPPARRNKNASVLYQSNLYQDDTDYMRTVGNRWALGFVGLGLCSFLGNLLLSTGFAVAGERMTRSLRKMAFEAMVRKRPSFLWLAFVLLRNFWVKTLFQSLSDPPSVATDDLENEREGDGTKTGTVCGQHDMKTIPSQRGAPFVSPRSGTGALAAPVLVSWIGLYLCTSIFFICDEYIPSVLPSTPLVPSDGSKC